MDNLKSKKEGFEAMAGTKPPLFKAQSRYSEILPIVGFKPRRILAHSPAPVPVHSSEAKATTPPLVLPPSAIENKHAISFDFLLNMKTEPVYGIQMSAFYNDAPTAGAQLSFLANGCRGSIRGLQVSSLNYTEGNVGWGQYATLINYAGGSVSHGQMSLLGNFCGGEVSGLQIGTSFNAAKAALGLQLSAGINVVSDMVGVQISGPLNVARTLFGVQFSSLNVLDKGNVVQIGTVNIARDIEGFQNAGVNVSDTMEGAQLGILNITNVLKGVQLGFVNISRKVDGVAVGLINYCHTGVLQGELLADELGLLHLRVKSGTDGFYTSLSTGGRPLQGGRLFGRPTIYGFGAGRRIRTTFGHVDFDATHHGLYLDKVTPVAEGKRRASPDLHFMRFSVLSSWKRFQNTSFHLGLSLNLTPLSDVQPSATSPQLPPASASDIVPPSSSILNFTLPSFFVSSSEKRDRAGGHKGWVGFYIGISYGR